MSGLASAFWSACAGVCHFFAACALQRSEWWVERAKSCNQRAAS